MKKNIVFLLFGLLMSSSIFAQENSVKANPLAVFGGTDLFSYERAVTDKSSGIVGAGFSSFKFGDFKYQTIGGKAEYRYYFNSALEGWFAGAGVQYQNGKVEVDSGSITFDGSSSTSDEINFNGIGVGAKGGYQWIWDSGFTLDLNLGLNYVSFSYDDSDNSTFSTLKGSGILPALGFGLGYSW